MEDISSIVHALAGQGQGDAAAGGDRIVAAARRAGEVPAGQVAAGLVGLPGPDMVVGAAELGRDLPK